jgi:hypothetical protein
MAGNAGELQKLSETPEYVALRRQKLPVALSSYAFRLLFMWLLEARYLVMLAILNAYVDIKVRLFPLLFFSSCSSPLASLSPVRRTGGLRGSRH